MDECNQNLDFHQKTLMKWHNKLGHLSMQHVQWLGRKGIIGIGGDKWGSTTVIPPKCSACLFGKQPRTTKSGKKRVLSHGGSLKKGMLQPGDLIFSNQYESRHEGKVFSYK